MQFTEVDYFEKVSKSNFEQAIYKLYSNMYTVIILYWGECRPGDGVRGGSAIVLLSLQFRGPFCMRAGVLKRVRSLQRVVRN